MDSGGRYCDFTGNEGKSSLRNLGKLYTVKRNTPDAQIRGLTLQLHTESNELLRGKGICALATLKQGIIDGKERSYEVI